MPLLCGFHLDPFCYFRSTDTLSSFEYRVYLFTIIMSTVSAHLTKELSGYIAGGVKGKGLDTLINTA